MCGRYALHHNPDVIALQFGVGMLPQFKARYNIAPSTSILNWSVSRWVRSAIELANPNSQPNSIIRLEVHLNQMLSDTHQLLESDVTYFHDIYARRPNVMGR